jgi:hypothetical protein
MRFACLALVLIACHAVEGSGTAARETRRVVGFESLSLSGPLDAEVRIGSPASVELTGDDNLLPLIAVEPAGTELRVFPSKAVRPTRPLVVHVVAPSLEEVSLSGSGHVTVTDVHGERFVLALSGSGSLGASGSVTRLEVTVSGSGTIATAGLAAETVKVAISGSGDGEVRATRSLDVQITGSGRLAYDGNPPDVRKNISGTGELIAR